MNSVVANQVYKAYNRASHTVAKTKQIVMLYDGALRFLAQAREAAEKKDIETRYKRLVKVSEIMMGLQASLDFDAGGPMANVLYDFYSDVDLRVFNLHQETDLEAYDPLMKELREMRDIWKGIDEKDADGATQDQAVSAVTPAEVTLDSNLSA